MKRLMIVIISQTIFPRHSPRALRATELAKEFARQGHDVTLYAVLGDYDYTDFVAKYNLKVKNIGRMRFVTLNSCGTISSSLINKILIKLFRKLIEFPDIELMFKIPRIIKKERNIDLLITIAIPYSLHWGAALAKWKNKNNFPRKWVADCGDPFMGNKFQEHPFYFKYIEKWFCRNVIFLTIPIESAKKGYYKEFYDKIRVIPQGFSFNKISAPNKFLPNDIPTFIYAGNFYKEFRDPKLFLEYLSSLNIEFKFIVFTMAKSFIEPFKEALGVKLEVNDYISREDLLEEMSKVDFLVNFENGTDIQSPSKLIDYALVNRPILSIKSNILEKNIINSFLKGDYKSQYIVENINQYNIENIAIDFIKLYNEN